MIQRAIVYCIRFRLVFRGHLTSILTTNLAIGTMNSRRDPAVNTPGSFIIDCSSYNAGDKSRAFSESI